MDPLLRRQTMDLVLSLGAEGKTVLVASHVLYEVEAVTDRILLLLRGHLRAEGGIREIRDLLDEVPRKLVVATPDPRALAAAAAPRDGVVSVKREQGRVTLESDRPEEVLRWLTNAAASGDVSIEEVYAADEDLESIFDLLVK